MRTPTLSDYPLALGQALTRAEQREQRRLWWRNLWREVRGLEPLHPVRTFRLGRCEVVICER